METNLRANANIAALNNNSSMSKSQPLGKPLSLRLKNTGAPDRDTFVSFGLSIPNEEFVVGKAIKRMGDLEKDTATLKAKGVKIPENLYGTRLVHFIIEKFAELEKPAMV